MQKFWYHSPVRFYKTMEELLDMTNPQNTQFFGSKRPYPLEISSYHRFLIPSYQNEVETEALQLWLVGDKETQIPCEFGIADGKLHRVTFVCFEWIQGRFEIRNEAGEKLFYSNCVKFIDSTDDEGRKYIRIASKNLYNRYLFPYANSEFDWMVTNLPARCLGQFSGDSEFETGREGSDNALVAIDNYFDEVVSYEFEGEGDSNIFTFILAHATNNTFYIDGTKRTLKEKPDIDEFSIIGKMKFVNQKQNGMNILLSEDEIFDDAMTEALGNGEKTLIYVYDNNFIIPTE